MSLRIFGGDITGKAVSITSDNGTVGLQAGNDITLSEGRHTQNLSTANKTTDKGFLSKTTTQSRFDSQSDTAISSNLEGNKVIMDAGNDVNLTATNAISDKGTFIKAGNDVNILAAQNTSSTSSEHSTKKSGVFSSGGLGFTIGKQKTENDNTQTALTHTASNIGAIDGNVSIEAGNHIQQTDSNVIAGIGDRQAVDSSDTERGNVVYRAKAVDIDNEMDKYTNQSEQKFKQSGLTVSVSNSLVDSAQNIDRLIDAAGNTSSQRMKGLAAISAGLKAEALYGEGKQAAKALQTGNLKDVGNTRIQATIGSSKSQSNSQSYTEQSQGSTVQAANNLAIIATGAGKDSNINVNASDITVGNNALFKTDNDLNISGVAQNEQTHSNNKSSSFGIGAYASTNPGGEGASFGITANASGAKGHANSDGTTYANSHINVGNTTTLDISNDVNIKGGVLTTDKLTGQVAGDLNMESLQDMASYDSKQKNAGFSADIDLSGNAQANSLSINGGKTNIDADYAAVTEQTGIYTQQSDLNVGGKGRFKGAAFTTASAEDNQSVFAQGIETSDIENYSNYDAKAIAAGITIGKAKDTGPQASLNGIGYGSDGDSDTRTTFAGVTGMAGQADVTTASKDSLNDALSNSFDANTVNEELGAQVEITRAFDQERMELKRKLYADVDEKKEQATNIRRQNGGHDTNESIRLEAEAAKLNEKVRWIDAGLGAIWGLGDTDMLKGMFGVTQADRARRSATAPKEMWFQTCSASTGGQCQSRQIWSLNDLTEEELNLIKKNEEVVTVSNPGIFNDKEASLVNAAKQNTNETNKIGTLVVMNPPTGKYDGWWILSSATSELMYAGYDKLNDILGGKLPLTNSEKLNQDIYREAIDKGLQIDTSSHSRGGLTSSVALKDLNNNQGIKQVPIRKARFYGTATNVQDYADQLAENGYTYTVTDEEGNEVTYQSGAYSAVHKADFVGRPPIILGGNPATGGECFKCYSHSSYFAEIPDKYLINSQGQYVDSEGRVVPNEQKIDNKNYTDYIKIWGKPKDDQNLSLPVLVEPKKTSDSLGEYNVNPF